METLAYLHVASLYESTTLSTGDRPQLPAQPSTAKASWFNALQSAPKAKPSTAMLSSVEVDGQFYLGVWSIH